MGPRKSASSQIAGVSAIRNRVRSVPRPPSVGAMARRRLSTTSLGAGRIHSARRPTTSQAGQTDQHRAGQAPSVTERARRMTRASFCPRPRA